MLGRNTLNVKVRVQKCPKYAGVFVFLRLLLGGFETGLSIVTVLEYLARENGPYESDSKNGLCEDDMRIAGKQIGIKLSDLETLRVGD